MNKLQAGFAKLNINPPMGTPINGYYIPRHVEGYLDDLEVVALALKVENTTVVMLSVDTCIISTSIAQTIRKQIAEAVNLPAESVWIHTTHTHTAPNLDSDSYPKALYMMEYLKYFAAAAAEGAIADLKESTFSAARSELPGITFVRRYNMKGGIVRNNPGRHNPDIIGPVSPADETIQLLKIQREGAGDIAIVNFQVHPDTRGGKLISADYPAVVCNTMEGALPGTSCLYMNGTAGDLNHVDVNCPEWDKNSGPEHSVHMGRAIAGKILSMYTKARPVATGPVRTVQKDVTLPLKQSTPKDVEYANEVLRLLEAGLKDEAAKFSGTKFNIAGMEANGILRRVNGPASTTISVCAASMGDFAIVGIPGEGFCEIGRQIREESPFAVHFMSGLTNGDEGYLPTADAYNVDGYESRTSSFLPGIAEALMDTGKTASKELFNG